MIRSNRPTTVSLASEPHRFQGLRRALERELPRKCGTAFGLEVLPGRIIDAAAAPQSVGEADRAAADLAEPIDPVVEADLLVVLIDEPAIEPTAEVAGSALMRAVARALSSNGSVAGGTDVMVFIARPEPDGAGRLRTVWPDVPIAALRSHDQFDQVLQIADAINAWLARSSRIEDEQAVEAAPVIGLGRPILFTRGSRWLNDRLGWLDSLVLGQPRPVTEARDGSLEARSDDEWDAAVDAYHLGSLDLTITHLERAIEIRPLHGPARLWLARLVFCDASVAADYEAVAEHARTAAVIFARRQARHAGHASATDQVEARRSRLLTGFASLLEAKALRALVTAPHGHTGAIPTDQLLHQARDAVDLASRALGWHPEPFVERCIIATLSADGPGAMRAARRAFERHPRSLHHLAALADEIDGLVPVIDHVTDELRVRMEDMVGELVRYRSEAAGVVDRRWRESVAGLLAGPQPPLPTGTAAALAADVVGTTDLDRYQDMTTVSAMLEPLRHNPIQMAEAAQTVINDNHRIIRTLELLIRTVGAAYGHSDNEMRAARRARRVLWKQARWEVPTVLGVAFLVGAVTGRWGWVLLALTVGCALVGYLLLRIHEDDQNRIERADAVRLRRWRDLAAARQEFTELVESFEADQLDWPYMRPVSSTPGLALRVLHREDDAVLIASDAVLLIDLGQSAAHPISGVPTEQVAVDAESVTGYGLYGRIIEAGPGHDERWRAYCFPIDDGDVAGLLHYRFVLPVATGDEDSGSADLGPEDGFTAQQLPDE